LGSEGTIVVGKAKILRGLSSLLEYEEGNIDVAKTYKKETRVASLWQKE